MKSGDNKDAREHHHGGGSIAAGILLLGVGIVVLVNTITGTLSFGELWPLFMFIPVAALCSGLVRDFNANRGSVFPIVLLSAFAFFFLYLNFRSWGMLSALWPLFMLIPGISFFMQFLFSRETGLLIPGSILTVLAVTFLSGSSNVMPALAAILIIIGIAILVKGLIQRR